MESVGLGTRHKANHKLPGTTLENARTSCTLRRRVNLCRSRGFLVVQFFELLLIVRDRFDQRIARSDNATERFAYELAR